VTIAVSLKVNDGLVLAADSAQTLVSEDGTVAAVYNNANKIVNLRKGLPIGIVFWGAGSIGQASLATVAKDLRHRFNGDDPDHRDWHLDPATYTLREVAEQTRKYIYEERYDAAFGDWTTKPDLGFIVAGYSAGASIGEMFQVVISDGIASELEPVYESDDTVGLVWNGQPEAITRLLRGFGTSLPQVLVENLGVAEPDALDATSVIGDALNWSLVHASMPIQDAIDLAEFLVSVTINFYRFGGGAPTVGGPIESAAITKYEGFKWVKRKHYFSDTLNREDFRGRDWGDPAAG
jgi:hypothetical protein